MTRSQLVEDRGACRCGGCRQTFGSLFAFDWHRRGPYGARMCLTAEQMTAAGSKPDHNGHWRSPKKYAAA